MSLESFLIMPMQRITKYPLLLRELLKLSEEGSKDYKCLVEAEQKMKDIVLEANEQTRKVENVNRLMDVQVLAESDWRMI